MKFVNCNDVTIHYTTTGKGGKPLVFINSLGTNLHIWDEVAAAFSHRQTVQYDKRGHGLSDVPNGPYTLRDHTNDLRCLLDHLHIKTAVLVGVSVGGMIALDFASQFPDRVEAMVLCDTAGKIGQAVGWNERIGMLEIHGLPQLTDSIIDRWFAPTTGEAMRNIGRNMLCRTPLEGYIGTCAAIRDADLRPTLPTLTMPTLVLCGAQDGATTPELVHSFANTLPNATFQLIDNAGHLPGWEQPQAVIQALRTFLQALPRPKFATGMMIRRSVLGDAHVDQATANRSPFDADFQRFIVEFAWGTVWAGETLDRKTRHLITLALLAALGQEREFALHVRATKNTAVSAAELAEALHHVAVYAGVPAANTAIGIAKKIIAETDGEVLDE